MPEIGYTEFENSEEDGFPVDQSNGGFCFREWRSSRIVPD